MDEKPENLSGDPQSYRDAITAQFLKIAEGVRAILPPEAFAKWQTDHLQALKAQFREGLWSKIERHKLNAFIERYWESQEVPSAELEALYNRRAELDRKLLGPIDP